MPTARLRALTPALFVAASCVGPGASAPPDRSPTAPVTEARVAMGTELRLTAWTGDTAGALEAFEVVYAEFERLEGLMSTWREDSEVSRVNAAAGGSPLPVSREVLDVLLLSRQISEWTGGKFDITFGALSDFWNFNHDGTDSVPDMDAVRARLPLIAWEDVEIDEAAGTVRLPRSGMSFNLGGIGKGYAVDRAVAILRDAGLGNFLIQAGGDLYVGGQPKGRPWRLGIQDPRSSGGTPFAVMDLADATFSTSGDYERFFIRDGDGQPERHHRDLAGGAGRRALDRRVHRRTRGGHGAHRAARRRGRRDCRRRQPAPYFVGARRPADRAGTSDRRAVASYFAGTAREAAAASACCFVRSFAL